MPQFLRSSPVSKDGVTIQAAQADTSLIAAQLEKQYPDSNHGQGALVLPLSEVIVGNIRPILLVLLGGAGLLLLIACVNVASLLLVRAESRRREMSVRSALGASRVRLIRQFVTEGLVLVAAGSLLGLASASWAMQLLTRLIPAGMLSGMPFLQGLGLNLRVSLFGCGIALLAAVLFSVTPALRLSFAEMREGLGEGSRGSAGNTWRRLGSKLVVVELATAMVLLVGAGLLGQSLYRLLHVELQFQPDHLATLMIGAPDSTYGKDPQSVALGRQIMRRVLSLPGVTSAGTSSVFPVSFNGNTDWIRFVGRPYNGQHNEVNEREVSAGYFAAIGAKMLRGRYFNETEDDTKPKVVIINQALVKKYFPGEDPIGKVIGDTELTPKSLRQIVGIVDDIREGVARRRNLAGRVSSVQPESEYLYVSGGSDFAIGAVHASGIDGVDSRDRSQYRDVRRSQHARPHRQLDVGLYAPFVRVAGGRLRGSGIAARRRGTVWRDCVLGKPANARNRSAHGAGRGTQECVRADPERGRLVNLRGHRRRIDLLAGGNHAHAQAAIRRSILGCADIDRRGRGAERFSASSQFHPSSASCVGKSGGCVEGGIENRFSFCVSRFSFAIPDPRRRGEVTY